jgi:hypothetical protein
MPDATLLSHCAADNCYCPIPDAVHPFVDLAKVWTRQDPRRDNLAAFRPRPRITNPPRWSLYPIWYIDFPQPKPATLAAIDGRSHWHLFVTELAMDWIYLDPEGRAAAWEFFHQHSLQRRHRDAVCFDHDTRYARRDITPSGRPTRINIVGYPDRLSKVTGQPCVHIEVRLHGAPVLRDVGIHSAEDLIGFDHHALWRERLLLFELDAASFGRYLINRRRGSRRRRPLIRRLNGRHCLNGRHFHVDHFVGALCLLASGGSVQDLLHHCRNTTLDVHRHLHRIAVPDYLLPPQDTILSDSYLQPTTPLNAYSPLIPHDNRRIDHCRIRVSAPDANAEEDYHG